MHVPWDTTFQVCGRVSPGGETEQSLGTGSSIGVNQPGNKVHRVGGVKQLEVGGGQAVWGRGDATGDVRVRAWADFRG